ncbi:ATP-binding protein [Comamonas aquatica]|jgi:nitrogen fixation/metabolism regulation signal transduction histidine kinase|uniref:histidine kinase n=1 Tax=Comamonas aquatica TaxID=225991 RepID=A0AA35GLT8_9BURK|nr:ATP-binding protein [Comamonas aquatica]MDH1902467.1 ATP-binding protein [Comamonas aquatica]WBM42349.1 ATP-binding protein [Comamonas aquatica]CAB5659007.1 Alginate biosynthesis sensor protein kinB [Comamonas aquatica]CAB5705265.1 Alginate biosynthesis sensor protein kinB [Comamonas aquatica]CAC9181777.1 Alginate biosynthesis sensor protein kinB [Comamonas aquatica]
MDASVSASRKSTRWALGVAGAVMCALGLILLFLLMQATNNRELYERHYAWLFGLNVLVAAALLVVLLWMGVRLAVRWRQRKFGSRLLFKLAAIFALVGVVPGLLIYVVSYQFVSRSIESWFDVKVEGALSAGVNLASVTLETIANDMANNTRSASQQLAQVPDAAAGLVLERIREQLGATDVILWNSAGVAVASAGTSLLELAPERPSAQQLRSLRAGLKPMASIEGLDEVAATKARDNVQAVYVKTLALVTNLRWEFRGEQRFLQASIPLPSALVTNALAVQDANREYQERALARQGLQRMYIGTLTLSLFLAVFGAVLLAVLLGNQLARPLLVLAQGVRDVARGDLTPKMALQTQDELGGLTRSFALMTQQLLDARMAVDKSMGEVKAARTNLQTILDNLTSGVLVLDDAWHVLSINPSATRILRMPMAVYMGRRLDEVPSLQVMADMVREQFALFLGDRGADAGRDRWQQVLELPFHQDADPQGGEVPHDKTTLVVRGAELPQSRRLIVFDDISEIVSAQRSKAWAEVARRVAHEIKNPLTPIQLSAERLALKLNDKLEPVDQALLNRSVKTIVDQVGAMLRLVNEFRDYARLPAAELQPLDLNALVLELLQLYGEENAEVSVQAKLDPHCPWIAGDTQQLRQVIHNLLQNAQDATLQQAQALGVAPVPVEISTQWVESSKRVRLSICDSGTGFAPHILQRAFEPYVTTKVRGTGLGLAVVKKIADEHGARIDLTNRLEGGLVKGAQVSLSFVPINTEAP